MRRLVVAGLYLLLLGASHCTRDAGGPARPPAPGQRLLGIPETARGAPTGRTIEMAYQDLGDAGADLRTPVVLLHGSPVASSALRPLVDRLRSRARLVVPDLPGFGSSTRVVADYSFEAHARATLELLDTLGIGRAHLVAYSMGGGVALTLGRLAPERVASISLVSALGVQELELLGDHALNHTVHGLQFAVLRALQELTPHFGLLDRFPLNTSYARNFLDSDQRPLRGILERFGEPLLIVHGRDDAFVPAAAAREHARVAPQARLEWVEGGHLVVIRRPELVAAPLLGFLEDVEGGRAATRAGAAADRLAAAAEPFDWRRHGGRDASREVGAAVLLGAATLASEDLACISGGLLVARGALGFTAATLGCLGGIFVGDGLLFLAGRWLGARALRRRPWCWLVSEARVARCAALFRRRGAALVLMARFLPGLRLPTYFAAGAVGMPAGRFFAYFALAAALWTPLLVGVSALAGERILGWVERLGNHGWMVAVGGIVAVWGGSRLALALATRRGRRLLLGWWRRRTRWEFWPAWMIYPPIAVHGLWLGLRHRGFTVFTAANPGMPLGGLAGESKAAILGAFPEGTPEIARFAVLEAGTEVEARLAVLDAFMARAGLGFPVVLKPDVGERGQGVGIIHDRTEAAAHLRRDPGVVIAQEYVEGREFGLFYARLPSEPRGRILSVTAKHLIGVRGDGRRTLEELILDDPRAVCMAPFFLRRFAARLGEIPPEGEEVRLAPLGTHCRGACFTDGREEVWSPLLEERLDALSRRFEGFYFGRYDVRTPSAAALRERGEFKVLELNGVSSESTHLYDPRNSLFRGWHILVTQWRLAFRIGAENRARGHRPAGAREILRAVVTHLGRKTYEA